MAAKDPQENYGNGWISIYRSIFKNWVWKDKPFSKGQAWIDILLECNHKTDKVNIKDQLFVCKRGESLNSQITWAERWGWNRSRVRRFLKLLKSDSMIELIPTNKTTKLIVSNYSSYQDKRTTDEQRMNNKRTSDEHQMNTNNKINKINKKKGKVKIIGNRELVIAEYFLDMLPIDSEQKFIESWVEWVDYRKEIKKKLTKSSVTKQIKLLLNQPDPSKCIDQSILNQWTGLFEDKSNGTNKNKSAGSVTSRLDYKFDPKKAAKRLKQLESTYPSRN